LANASTISFKLTSQYVNEGDGTANISVLLDRSDDMDSGQTVRVDYTTVPGTAVEGTDSTKTANTLTFGPGVTLQVISVPITNDTAVENPETFDVILFNPSANATLGNTTTHLTILDNDSTTGTIGFASATYSINENPINNPGNASSVTLTVTRAGDTTKVVDVDYSTRPLSAQENTDYQGSSGTLEFLSGQTSKTITIPVFNDTFLEGDETFAVDLTPNFGGISTSTVTIVDDEGSTVSFSSGNYSVSEGGGLATITLLRTGNTSVASTVSVVTVGGTAAADVDYVTTAQ